MKKLFITLFAAMACLACFTISNANTFKPRENTIDTLRELTYKAYMVSSCDQKYCYDNVKRILKDADPASYMMVFKISANKWLFEKKGNLTKLDTMAIKKVVFLTDNIQINKKNYRKVKHVVIVE